VIHCSDVSLSFFQTNLGVIIFWPLYSSLVVNLVWKTAVPMVSRAQTNETDASGFFGYISGNIEKVF